MGIPTLVRRSIYNETGTRISFSDTAALTLLYVQCYFSYAWLIHRHTIVYGMDIWDDWSTLVHKHFIRSYLLTPYTKLWLSKTRPENAPNLISETVLQWLFVSVLPVSVYCLQMKLAAALLIYGRDNVDYTLPVELPRNLYCNKNNTIIYKH